MPEVVGWETTLRCNMRCRHCGSTAGAGRSDELDTAQALDLCRQLSDLRVPRVCLTGGETLLRPDWEEITRALLDGGIEVGILTNGSMTNGRVLDQLVAFRGTRLYVSVSIDGTEADHDRIRDVDGSWARALACVSALKAGGIPVAVITTVSRANLAGLPALRRAILSELQPYAWQIQITTPFGRALDNDESGVGPVEYTQVVCFVCETRRLARGTATGIFAGDCLGYRSSLDPGLRPQPWSGCQAGMRILGIQSNGNIKGCLSIIDDDFVEGSLRAESLAALWRRPTAFAYTRQFKPESLRGICAGCPAGSECRGGCTASSVSAHQEPHHAPFCMRAFEEVAALNPSLSGGGSEQNVVYVA